MAIATCRATREERLRPMPGDGLVAAPILSLTHAIDLAVDPERAWPWLVQMGAGRAGWYSWDGIDNGGRRSADRLVPELQHVAVGDLLPAVPGARDAFVVARVDAPRDLVLEWPGENGGSRGTWEFVLSPVPGGSRLVVRGRLGAGALQPARSQRAERTAAVARLEAALLRLPIPLMRPLGAIGHRLMQVRQLRGIKRRADRSAH
jgi:hypothetical protein